MKQFNEIDPLTISQDPRVVASIQDDRNPNITYYFLIDADHLILATADYFTDLETQESEWLHYQIEFPKRGLQWYLDTLQHKFFKTEAEGGLPKGQFHDKTEIDGERLKLGRAFNADGNGGGGYSFVTLDRKESYGSAKEHTFTDAFLFKGGLIQILLDIAGKIKAGQL
ncbi:hypothetical protein [Pseudoalteromonas sp. TB41]|uniref:hypothetical protein n=1 Tax=unclassified Pseudoalteromonas TaxID=194690 RepID=UPI00042942AF|nr:hypothetical protein [Pseudoalteromonas sp. TB41]PHQ95252.1 MAG: hypothetical protein COB48_03370 [Pseudoalteromonas sp.]